MKTLQELERLIAEDRAAGGTNGRADAGGWLLAARKNHFPGAVIGRCRWWWWILLTLGLGLNEALDILRRAHRMEAAMWKHVGSSLKKLIDAHEAGYPLTDAQRAELCTKLAALVAAHKQPEAICNR